MSFEGIGSELAPQLGGQQVARLQYAGLCYRVTRKGPQVLLVTSRETGRWLLPKGWPIDGLTPAQTAAREAREEGGVKGVPVDECLGFLSYVKLMPDAACVPCLIAVYPVRVRNLAARYPEMHQRQRKWVSLTAAAAILQEPEAQKLLIAFSDHPLVQVPALKPGKRRARRARR